MATSGASVQGRGNDVLDRRDHFVDTSQNSESFHHPPEESLFSSDESKPFHSTVSTVDNLEYGYFHVSCFDPLFLFYFFDFWKNRFLRRFDANCPRNAREKNGRVRLGKGDRFRFKRQRNEIDKYPCTVDRVEGIDLAKLVTNLDVVRLTSHFIPCG